MVTLADAVPARLHARVIHTDDFASWDEPLSCEWHDVDPGGVVLIEGVCSSRRVFRPYLAAAVWVDTPREVRLDRGLDRDGATAVGLWSAWMVEEYYAWIADERPAEAADLIVPGS